ncbi:hypothetical protein DFH09DRAFT_41233 [Mycena vulgaris]|nr:hypothetical protein DFH09DRAFT_41233 [Mycena vulgaris]
METHYDTFIVVTIPRHGACPCFWPAQCPERARRSCRHRPGSGSRKAAHTHIALKSRSTTPTPPSTVHGTHACIVTQDRTVPLRATAPTSIKLAQHIPRLLPLHCAQLSPLAHFAAQRIETEQLSPAPAILAISCSVWREKRRNSEGNGWRRE